MYSLPLLQKSLFIVINKIETNEIEDLIGEHILLITELLTCYRKFETHTGHLRLTSLNRNLILDSSIYYHLLALYMKCF